MLTFKKFISEGINDKGLFKAIFIVGVPGGGKSYTVTKMAGDVSPRIVNTDKAAEFISKKIGKEITSSNWRELYHDKSTKMTLSQLQMNIDGMLPLFIDGTSNDVSNTMQRMGILGGLGYDVGIISISCPLKVALKSAKERGEKTGRIVDEEFIKAVHETNEENAKYLKNKVSFFREIQNTRDELGDKEISLAFKAVKTFFDMPVENPIGQKTLSEMKKEKMKYLSDGILSKHKIEDRIRGWYQR